MNENIYTNIHKIYAQLAACQVALGSKPCTEDTLAVTLSTAKMTSMRARVTTTKKSGVTCQGLPAPPNNFSATHQMRRKVGFLGAGVSFLGTMVNDLIR